MKIEDQIKSLLKALSENIYEKEHILALALLSAIAGESIFLLGPPGTAKSLVARRLKLAFQSGTAFEYLMSRFSTPDEIFGPVSISLLKNEDRYERVIEGFLPSATVVFLDEIWKASPSIQNALLTAINERIFQNGRETIHLPLKALIAASNELPAEEEGLEALWDRFLVRMVSNCIQNESTFYKMLRQQSFELPKINNNIKITEEQYLSWQQEIEHVNTPDEICSIITFIRRCLKEETMKEEVHEMDYYISDRRWKKSLRLMRTSAFLNGRKEIDLTEIPLLMYCLWNKSETIPIIINIVVKSLFASTNSKLDKFEKEIELALKKKSSSKEDKHNSNNRLDTFSLTNYLYYSIRNFSNGKCLFYKTDYQKLSNDKPVDGIIYQDPDKNAWIIHVLYTGAPFEYKVNSHANISKIKLLKCNGGIIIDGTPFAFEKSIGLTTFPQEFIVNNPLDESNIAVSIIESIDNELRPKLSEMQDSFINAKNIFLSNNDINIVKKYITSCNKRISEVYVKAQNAQKLL